MNTKPILMIDVKKDSYPWVVVENGKSVKRGTALDFRELANVQHDEQVAGVWIDEGYRTMEVISAARAFGWLTFKGRSNCYGPADMIREMLESGQNVKILAP